MVSRISTSDKNLLSRISMGGGGGGGGGPTTTFSPTNKMAGIVLSNGNLTATGSGAAVNQPGGSTGTIIAGQRIYWEFNINNVSTGIGIGFINPTYDATTASYLGVDANGLGYFSSGQVFLGNALAGTLDTWTTGNVLGIAIDFNAGLWWETHNGTTWNGGLIAAQNPAIGSQVGGNGLGVSGNILPAYNVFSSGQVTLNPGPSFAYAVPTGFTHLP